LNTTLPADWPDTLEEARAYQLAWARRVSAAGEPASLRRIGGVDVHFGRDGLAWAAVALVEATGLELVASTLATAPARFPYVPGYLSFREVPAVLRALSLLEAPPDLLMVDGQGIAHPRRLGIAAHLGVITDLPTIGVAKSRLFGRFEPPATARGSWSPLTARGETIGAVVRSRDGVQPLFVSVGHRIGLEPAIELTLRTVTRYRLPEPTRLADKLSRCHPT
jgi:deoxyribonuclease V